MKKIISFLIIDIILLIALVYGLVYLGKPSVQGEIDQPYFVYNSIVESKINETRETLGLKSVIRSARLVESSKLKADQIERTCTFAHDIEYNNDWVKTFTEAKVKSTSRGEILARGFKTPEGVVRGWIGSKTHYDIMVGEYKYFGIYSWKSDCDGKMYVVGHFSD